MRQLATENTQESFVYTLRKPSIPKETQMPTIEDFVKANSKFYWKGRHHKDSTSKIKRFFEFYDYGSRPINSFKPSDIYVFFDHLSSEGLTNSTINRYAASISGTFKYAVEEGVIDQSQKPLIRWRETSSHRPRYFSQLEIERLEDFFSNHPRHSWMLHFFRLALNTGMRKGEIRSIGLRPSELGEKDTHGQVDLENRRIHLSNTKNGESRSVPLNDNAIEALKALDLKPSKYYSNKPFYQTWRQARDVVCNGDQAKMENFVFHITRHTCASRLTNIQQIPTALVKSILGHKTIATTLKYVHEDGAALDQIMSAYGRAI